MLAINVLSYISKKIIAFYRKAIAIDKTIRYLCINQVFLDEPKFNDI